MKCIQAQVYVAPQLISTPAGSRGPTVLFDLAAMRYPPRSI